MFAARVHKIEEEEKKDVFAPVADLMVGVVFIFIIMVLALSLVMMEDAVPRPLYDQTAQELKDVTAERDALKKRADQFAEFVSYLKTGSVVPLLDRLAEADATRAKILQMLKERLATQGVAVEADFRSGVLRLPTGNLFESGEADPTPHGREVIRLLGAALADTVPCFLPGAAPPPACPPQSQGSVLNAVYIEGHTDAAPLRGVKEGLRDNWDLSAARAIEAFRIVRDSDPRAPNLKNAEGKSLLGVSGYADTRPVTEGLSDKQRADKAVMETDRRIEVRLIMAVNRDQVEKALRELNQRLERLDAGAK
ncbi:flagellar motor protein MotB [Rhodoblastus sp.]|uniref:OmpA/MotB family protein n=1 Tax=Rhodoblastus sp. TaxID=1962975 RepID=UPI0035B48D0B